MVHDVIDDEQREALLKIGLHHPLPGRHEMVDLELSACLSGGVKEKVDFLDWLNSVGWTRGVHHDASA